VPNIWQPSRPDSFHDPIQRAGHVCETLHGCQYEGFPANRLPWFILLHRAGRCEQNFGGMTLEPGHTIPLDSLLRSIAALSGKIKHLPSERCA